MNKCMKFVFALLFCGSVVYGTGRWSLTGSLNTARSGAQSVMLTDSKIMVFGGLSSQACTTYEVLDPATGIWEMACYDSALEGNDHTTAVLLPSGNVLLENNHGKLWLYAPTINTWQNTWLSWQTSASGSLRECWNLLNDGRVLFVDHPGGIPCYLYEWDLDTLRRIADNIDGPNSLYDRSDAAEVRLPNGTAMVVGGQRLDMGIYKSCEIFDPGTETFSYTDSLLTGLTRHVAVLLRTNPQKVLTAGGPTTTSQLYDASTQKWSYSGAQNISPRLIPALALLPNGKALLMGGSGLNSCELYDPLTGMWTNTDPMTVDRWHFSATILPTGKVLACGEYNQGGDVRTEIYDPAENAGWTTKAQLNEPRCAATATLLPRKYAANCSSNVLIVGGEDSAGTALASCELLSYRFDTTVYTGSLNTPRTHHTTNLTADPDGKVFVTGGKGTGGTALSSCEIYSLSGATRETWTNNVSMSTPRFDHASTLLKDGTIFVTGGENTAYTNTCEIFNGSIWITTGAMTTARARHSAVLLLNGNVMVTGGETSAGTPTNTCEMWNPAAGTWTSVGNMTTARCWHSAVLLQNGKVLVIGGKNGSGTALSSCEIYDPTTGQWTAETNLNQARYLHSATMTYAGLVMVSGGNGDLTSCELYDPATHEWKNTGTLTSGRSYFSTILVPGIKPFVYAIGGSSGGNVLGSIERFDFGLGYESPWQSRIYNYSPVTCISSTMDIEGSLFRDITEADGGNHCHVSNQDHPIISLVRIGGGNFQSNGGGDIITMPLSSYWDTSRTTVHPQVSDFMGYYRLWSIVNGIPCLWFEGGIGAEEKSNIKSPPGRDVAMLQILKNPFSKSTVITYFVGEVSQPRYVSLAIYDLSGRCLKTLVKGEKKAGNYSINLNAKDLKTGIYFVKLTAGNYSVTEKMILLK
ncbi:MAG: kelch repeat-containing protein [bacterium]